jgi:hypothetical protein
MTTLCTAMIHHHHHTQRLHACGAAQSLHA